MTNELFVRGKPKTVNYVEIDKNAKEVNLFFTDFTYISLKNANIIKKEKY